MSFGSGGAGGFSFGSNNTNSGSGFGGFGNNSNNNTGFGSTSGTGFGSTPAPANPFGGSTFGSNTGGGFGSNTQNTGSSLFGNKSTFGTSTPGTGGGLFGNTASSTGTGFGTGSGTAFGSGSSAGGFGANNNASSFGAFGTKPTTGFGSSAGASPGNSLFGQVNTGTTAGFGNNSGFGSPGTGTALNQNVPPSEGTAGTPFNPTVENDLGTTNKNSFQSITFQPPYQKYSFEELRLADYNGGRRFGNGSGQPGAFGSSTFGGIGSSTTNTGFGASSNPFGGTGSSTTNTGFGSSLFGNNNTSNTNKPSGGLFGQQSSATSTGGLFGTSSNTTTGFGSGSTTAFGSNTGSSLFGNNQNQNKPAGLFGNTANTATTNAGFSFGGNTATSNTSGGLFGNSASTGAGFGGNNQNTSGGLFGGGGFGSSQNNQPQKPNLFGGGSTGFGAATTPSQPSGGLFSNTQNTSGGLFGSGNQGNNAQPSGGLFSNTNTNTSGGLFGQSNNQPQQQNKPGGLFGGGGFGGANNSSNGGLFGANQNNNQNQSNSLFGNSSGGLFGNNNSTAKPSGGLFGGSTNNQTSGGLFGQSGTSGGLFGLTQNTQQNPLQQQDGPKAASQLDNSPYTRSSIWTGLPEATPQSSAPLLTPLSSSTRLRESASKPPTIRLNQSRYNTPPARRGYGFTYSTYGTPNSAASTPGTGGLSTSMYNGRGFTGGSFGRSLHKSFSSSSLRPSYGGDNETVLSPGAFAPGSSRYSSGSIRRLTIDRSLRTDLFSKPEKPAVPAPPARAANVSTSAQAVNGDASSDPQQRLRKRVSFDKDITEGPSNNSLDGENGALVQVQKESDDETVDNQPPRRTQPNKETGPEMEQVRGRELAAVPEDREAEHAASPRKAFPSVQARPDPTPGDYYMKPSRQEQSKIPRDQLRRFTNFEVGRKGCGYVIFNDPVDLTTLNLDELYDKIVEIRVRSITVYPDPSTKPPAGKGLNVPSTLHIENSWPRARNQPSSATSGTIFDKHVNRLKKMVGTQFLKYDIATGVWTFKVPHYTRYGLDYDDDDDDDQEMEDSSPTSASEKPSHIEGSAMYSDKESSNEPEDENDTFAFKQKLVPGGFGRKSMVDYDTHSDPASASEHSDNVSDDESDRDDKEMAGTFPQPESTPILISPAKSVLKPWLGTPRQSHFQLDGDWADQLQQTISPRKQNREALRELQNKILLDRTYEPIKPQVATKPTEFRNSMDLMNSLFGKYEKRQPASKRGEQPAPEFEFPYSKRAKSFESNVAEMSPMDRAFHASFKPKWTTTGQLITTGELLSPSIKPWDWGVATSLEDVIVNTLNPAGRDPLARLRAALSTVDIDVANGVPTVHHRKIPFSARAHSLSSAAVSADSAEPERVIYELAHVLFDDYDDNFTAGLSSQQKTTLDSRICKDRLTDFLSIRIGTLVHSQLAQTEKDAPEEAAILHLTAKNIKGACDVLKDARDYHLMLLIAQIDNADAIFQDDIAAQITAWRDQDITSEISEPIRALYEILSGNTATSAGNPSGSVEDRSSTFMISERFGLNWMQSFGLCLWYGRHKNDPLEAAVRDFASQLRSQQIPFPHAQGTTSTTQESPLWVLLKLYASMMGLSLEQPVLPQALSSLSTAFDFSTLFSVHHALASCLPKLRVETFRADQLATDLASQYSSSGSYLEAAYALLHLDDPSIREVNIRNLLKYHAAALPQKPDESTVKSQPGQFWLALTMGLKIPEPWIFEAKALFARSRNDSVAELNYLMSAEAWSESHECFCRRVAPRLVLDEDWTELDRILHSFAADPQDRIADWPQGGAIYVDYSRVAPGSRERSRKISTKETETVLSRLQESLTEMGRRFSARGNDLTAGGMEELEGRVACKEMSRTVAELMSNMQGSRVFSTVLDLPLTADARLTQTREMGLEYFRAALVQGR